MVGKDERSKLKLKDDIEHEIKEMFKSILDFIAVSLGDQQRFDAVRPKILRAANDAKRSIFSKLDMYYSIEYVPNKEDIIQVVQRPRDGESVCSSSRKLNSKE